jgi:hypothetical protein
MKGESMTSTATKTNWLNIALVALNAVIWCYAVKYLLDAFVTFDRVTGYMP